MRGKPKLRTQRLFLNHPSLNKLLVSLSPHETQPSKHICNQGLRGMNNLLKHILYRWVHELKTATTTHYATTKSQANLLELESLSLNLNGWVNFSIFTPPPLKWVSCSNRTTAAHLQTSTKGTLQPAALLLDCYGVCCIQCSAFPRALSRINTFHWRKKLF